MAPTRADVVLKADVKLQVVFSGTKRRHPATLKAWTSDGDKDLALIKIQPFPGMPTLSGIDTSLKDPPRGMSLPLRRIPIPPLSSRRRSG